MGKDKEVLVVFCTVPPDEAGNLARALVEKKLAACVNVVPSLVSFYWWRGEIQRDNEALLIIKTSSETYPVLEETIKKLHPYTVPEIIALPVEKGNPDYLTWLKESLGQMDD
ncbi:MAG: divalent-cation tolerance protein CutA [Thermotogae bacterium]|nr:divalent-cation tolerance protein CutA [Thermotogota bacterium]